MNVAMMQPAFMPWQGLFELIGKSDVFVFLDDFQFSVQSYHQRNRLFLERGHVGWYTVPVLKSVSFKLPLCRTQTNEQTPWRRKMWKRLVQNYRTAEHFPALAPQLEQWLMKPWESLAAQNMAFISWVSGLLGFERKFLLSSSRGSQAQRSARVLEILRGCDATRYYSARGSFSYMKEDGLFPLAGLEVLFQDFRPRPYPQVGSPTEFVPYLSAIDALMNVGPQKTRELVASGTERWLDWETMQSNGLGAPARADKDPDDDQDR